MVLYHALDSAGNTLDFLLNATRSRQAAKRFFRKVLGAKQIMSSRAINVDKNPTYIVCCAETLTAIANKMAIIMLAIPTSTAKMVKT